MSVPLRILLQEKKVLFTTIAGITVIFMGMILPDAIFPLDMESSVSTFANGHFYALTHSLGTIINWNVIMIYLGVSFLCSLFPLTEDILNYFGLAFHGEKGPSMILKILSLPLALITRAGAFCERNCINFILAAAFIAIHILFVL